MSIASAIQNLQGRVQAAYTALENKGATIPAQKTTSNLVQTINSIELSNVATNLNESLTYNDIESGGKVIQAPFEYTVTFVQNNSTGGYLSDLFFCHNLFFIQTNYTTNPIFITDNLTKSSWTRIQGSQAFKNIFYCNDKYYIIPSASTKIRVSDNGTQWTAIGITGIRYCIVKSSIIVATVYSESTGSIRYSTDGGYTWQTTNISGISDNHETPLNLGSTENSFICLKNSTTNKYLFSTDGITWSEKEFPYGQITNLIYSFNGLYFVRSYPDNWIYCSDDSLIWRKTDLQIPSQFYMQYESQFYYCCNGIVQYYSTNGLNWINVPNDTTLNKPMLARCTDGKSFYFFTQSSKYDGKFYKLDFEKYSGVFNPSVSGTYKSLTVQPTTASQTISLDSNDKQTYIGYDPILVNPVTAAIDSNIQAVNIKSGVTILGVNGTLVPGITPSGNINITSTTQTDVTNYATAQVVDSDLVAGNIKKDVNILGITGTYEGSGGLQGYTLTVTGSGSGGISFTAYHPDGTSESVSVSDGTNLTVNNVAYINISFYTSGLQAPYLNGNHNILLLSDTTLNFSFPCILKGTLVNLWNGHEKKIEDIMYSDELLCWDFDNGKYASAKPFWIKKAQTNTFYWINKFKSGKVIKTTGTVAGHRFFDLEQNKFLYNTECKGHLCYTMDGPDILIDCEYVEGECEFYNVYTNYHMNLFANGILTGFRYNNLYPVKDMKFIKNNRQMRSREEFKSIPDSWFYGMRCSEQTDSVDEITSYAMSREIIKL